ncbi:MAG: hypothetical protein QXJ64_06200 [Thermosphaera sp.]
MLSWIIRMLLLLHFSIGFLKLLSVLLQLYNKTTLLYYIVTFMLASLYVSALFTKGAYSILFDSNGFTVIPSMRSTAANIMLDNTGKLDTQVDPHYLYPLEFLVVYIIKITLRIPYLLSYVLVFGIFTLALNSLIICLLVSTFNCKSKSDIALRMLSLGLLFHLLSLFYLGEYSAARSLFYLVIYIFLNLSLDKFTTSNSLILLFLLIMGITIGSLRVSIIVSLFLVLAAVYSLLMKDKRASMLQIVMSMIPIAYMWYYGALYVRSYNDYFAILMRSLWNAIIYGFFEVKRPPLHTVVQSQYHNSYVIMSFLGGLSFIVLLIVSYIKIFIKFFYWIIYLYRSSSLKLEKSVDIATGLYEIVFIVAALLSGAILGLAYILNVLGYFTIDFETMIDFLLFMPIALMPLVREYSDSNHCNQRSKVSLTKATTPVIAVALILLLAFSFFGLRLRYPIICMSEAILVPNNPLLSIQCVSKTFEFFVVWSSPGLRVKLSSYFSMHYLVLPLSSLGTNPTVVLTRVLTSELFSKASIIYDNGLAYLLSSPDGIVTFFDEIRLMPY